MVEWHHINKLLACANISEAEKERIEDRLVTLESIGNDFAEEEYYLIIESLQNNQLDPITYGFNYNQTDIRRKLKQL